MKNIVIRGWMLAIAIFVVMFGGIFLTIGTGHWSTTRDSEPTRFASGEFNPADIRGSYAFSEIEAFFGVPLKALFDAFMIPEALRKPDFQVKNLEGMFAPVVIEGEEIEVGTDLVRVFTSLYSGLPYDTPESEYLPKSAIRVLVDAGKLDRTQQAYREERSFDLRLVTDAEVAAEPDEVAAEPVATSVEIAIKGRTTMGELAQYGITREQFKALTGVEMPGSAVSLRDFATQNGLDMETIKTGLEGLSGLTAEETVAVETTPSEATAEPTEPPVTSEPDTSAIDIKGSTLIADILEAGLTAEQFTDITGVAAPSDTGMQLKDFVDANGLDMEIVRTKILETLAQ